MTEIPKIWWINTTAWTEDQLNYCLEHGWDVMWGIATYDFMDTDRAESVIAAFDTVQDAGISAYIDIENVMCGYDTWGAWGIPYLLGTPDVPEAPFTLEISEEEYDTLFGDCLRLFDDVGSVLKGILTEGGMYNGTKWLRAGTSKPLVNNWMTYLTEGGGYYLPDIGSEWWEEWWGERGLYNGNADNYQGLGAIPIQLGTLDWRIEQFDMCLFQMLWAKDVVQAIELGEYYRANYPDKPYGVYTAVMGDPLQGEYRWARDITGPAVPLETQKRLASNAYRDIQNEIGRIDCFEIMTADPGAYDPSYIEQLTWWDNCKGVWGIVPQDMLQAGLTPTYEGASYCDYLNAFPPDTFVNTGNEIIVVKEYAPTATAHEITVTSSNSTYHEDYSITALPERGTILGTFPTRFFGNLPTITYDTTNLYIAVLKDDPYV